MMLTMCVTGLSDVVSEIAIFAQTSAVWVLYLSSLLHMLHRTDMLVTKLGLKRVTLVKG